MIATSRRTFLGGALATAAALPLQRAVAAAENATQAPALPTPDQLAWQDLEVGMFVHFAPNTWQDKEGDDLSTPLDQIDPDIRTDNWAECAVKLGARYIVFVAKHVGGFCMWNTQTTPYGIGHTPWKGGHGDVLRDLSASCRKYGLKLGVYLSPRDDYFGAGTGAICKDPSRQAAYNAMYRTQLTEVLSRYGEMVEVWFDGSSVVPVDDILRKFAPHAAIFQGPSATIRWVGNEDGFAPYPLWNAESQADARGGISTSLHGDPQGSAWIPIECDISIRRPNWFWSTANENRLLTLDQLLEVYYRSVGRGAQLLLNIPADRRGLLPDADCARAAAFGAEIKRRFAKSVAEVSGVGADLELRLPKPGRIDHVLLQEDCSLGQRVRAFRLEGLAESKWIGLYEGSSIGHKRIVPLAAHAFSAVRIRVTESAGKPHIRRLAAFDTQAAPPPTWDAPTQIWADDSVGRWDNSRFELDLSASIHEATQFRLRFVPETGKVRAVENPSLLLDGAPTPHLLRPVPSRSDELILTMPGIGQKVVLRGTIEGADHGTILMKKL